MWSGATQASKWKKARPSPAEGVFTPSATAGEESPSPSHRGTCPVGSELEPGPSPAIQATVEATGVGAGVRTSSCPVFDAGCLCREERCDPRDLFESTRVEDVGERDRTTCIRELSATPVSPSTTAPRSAVALPRGTRAGPLQRIDQRRDPAAGLPLLAGSPLGTGSPRAPGSQILGPPAVDYLRVHRLLELLSPLVGASTDRGWVRSTFMSHFTRNSAFGAVVIGADPWG